MAESAAQSTAPEPVSQPAPSAPAEPTCDHCGSPIPTSPLERDCCSRLTAQIQSMQFDSARQSARYVIALTKRVAALEDRLLEIETRPRKGKA